MMFNMKEYLSYYINEIINLNEKNLLSNEIQ